MSGQLVNSTLTRCTQIHKQMHWTSNIGSGCHLVLLVMVGTSLLWVQIVTWALWVSIVTWSFRVLSVTWFICDHAVIIWFFWVSWLSHGLPLGPCVSNSHSVIVISDFLMRLVCTGCYLILQNTG